MTRFNPLLDDKKPTQPTKTVTASDNPPSPFGGAPMVSALCRKTPVYVDMVNRIVIPIKKTSY